MILSDSEVASLKSALHCWEWAGYLSPAVVGIGCIGEFIAEFTSLYKREDRKHRLSKLSLIVLILGIAGDLLSAARTSQLSGHIIANIEERAGDAERKAGEANGRTSANEKDAARLSKEAAELGQQNIANERALERERTARLEGLEATVGWHSVSPRQLRILQSELKSIGNSPVATEWSSFDPETNYFAKSLADALAKCGLTVTPHHIGILFGPNAGISLNVGQGLDPIADTIAKALVKAGSAKAPMPRGPWQAREVVITIGQKVAK